MKETVLVIREYDKFSEILIDAGFEVVNFQAILTLPVEDLSELDEKIGKIENCDGFIFDESESG